MEKMDKNDCLVCCEKIRYAVDCECGFQVCRNCVRTYLAGQVSEPHCMNCKLAWNMEFLENAIGKTYLKTDYKKQRASVFVEFEKTQLPDMQEEARIYELTERLNKDIQCLKKENETYAESTFGCNWCIGNKYKMFSGCNNCKHAKDKKEVIRMENTRVKNLTNRVERIQDKIHKYERANYNPYNYRYCHNYRFKCGNCSEKFHHTILYSILTDQTVDDYITCERCSYVTCFGCFGEYKEGHSCLMPECNCWEYECDTCLHDVNDTKIENIKEQIKIINKKDGQSKERKTFIMKCQINGCEGFLSQQYKCGLCSEYTCSQCYMPKGENHTCNPDDVASTKMIKEETRPCPKCSARIYKIDGCDQMWCTDCKTAFSWRTGTIVNGNIHNPHYYEYLRNTQGSVPRADQPYNPCGEIMDNYQLRAFRQQFVPYIKNTALCSWIETQVTNIHRYLGEINDVVETTNAEVTDMTGDRFVKQLRHNRILFLLKRIEKEKFEHDAFMYHQRSIQFRRFLELAQMLKQVVLDLFNNMYTALNDEVKKEKKMNTDTMVTVIQDTFKELFGVIRYFRSQHTYNPFTKILTDHYDTSFTIYTTKNNKQTTFNIPNEINHYNYTQNYQLIFAYFSDKEKMIKHNQQAAELLDY
jgi:hypothetical protein